MVLIGIKIGLNKTNLAVKKKGGRSRPSSGTCFIYLAAACYRRGGLRK
jgi:hypothetical protein